MGGRGAGRSTAASQFALANLMSPNYFRCAIMRYVLGDIRNSIYQDIVDRAEENEVKEKLEVWENILSIQYGSNKINGIGFRKSSSDQKAKLKSLANYNCVIIEEADEVSEVDFMQLDDSIRTMKSHLTIVLLLNPPHKSHWIIKRWFNLIESEVPGFYQATLKEKHTDTLYIHTTYLDNIQNIGLSTRANYENYKTTLPDHYYNMIRGLVSEGARGRIFKNWTPISDEAFNLLPYPSFYGLDFGFTNDPTALVELKTHNKKLWAKELIYETGLTNQLIANRFRQLGISKHAPIYADSSEPKSIVELQHEGWNVLPSVKGADSVRNGINFLLSFEVCYTESSLNLIIENQEYKWALGRDKEPTNEPIDDFNHGIDGTRYGAVTHLLGGSIKEGDFFFA